MKIIATCCLLLLAFGSSAQPFSFQDTVTTLIKTTDQSPAHWYIEIFNDVMQDTTLRWKASFDPNLPPQWVITLDDQDNFHQSVNDGDSADFLLHGNPAFPQKLIIGAILNNTEGTASVYFDIYDPDDPSFVQTIEYHFIISMGSGTWGTDELLEDKWFTQSGRTFTFSGEFESSEVSFYDTSGKLVYTQSIDSNTISMPSSITHGVYFIRMKSENTFYSSRVVLN